MHAQEMSEEIATVTRQTGALEAARMMAERRLPALVVVGPDGQPESILPASEVVRCLVPSYVQDDPSLAGVLSESMADRIAERLGTRTVRDLLPREPQELPQVNHDDTIIEVAALMARLRTPMVAVLRDHRMIGVITASRLLQVTLNTDRDG